MKSFKNYVLLKEKRKNKKRKKNRKHVNVGVYGMPYYWHNHPTDNVVGEIGGEASE